MLLSLTFLEGESLNAIIPTYVHIRANSFWLRMISGAPYEPSKVQTTMKLIHHDS